MLVAPVGPERIKPWKPVLLLLLSLAALVTVALAIVAIRSEIILRKNASTLGFLSECAVCNTGDVIARLWPVALGLCGGLFLIELLVRTVALRFWKDVTPLLHILNVVTLPMLGWTVGFWYLGNW
jgi:hypothetical protein